MISDQFSRQPQKRFLKVIVALGGNVIILQVLFAVKCNCFGLDFAIFYVDFVAAEDNGDVVADTDQVACCLTSLAW